MDLTDPRKKPSLEYCLYFGCIRTVTICAEMGDCTVQGRHLISTPSLKPRDKLTQIQTKTRLIPSFSHGLFQGFLATQVSSRFSLFSAFQILSSTRFPLPPPLHCFLLWSRNPCPMFANMDTYMCFSSSSLWVCFSRAQGWAEHQVSEPPSWVLKFHVYRGTENHERWRATRSRRIRRRSSAPWPIFPCLWPHLSTTIKPSSLSQSLAVSLLPWLLHSSLFLFSLIIHLFILVHPASFWVSYFPPFFSIYQREPANSSSAL